MRNLWRSLALATLTVMSCFPLFGQGQGAVRISDVYTNKARYMPNEEVRVFVVLKEKEVRSAVSDFTVRLSFWHLGEQVGGDVSRPVAVSGSHPIQVAIPWMPPDKDFRGYFVEVCLIAKGGHVVGRSQTAIDVSSDWKRFPRYGYLAHYSESEGAIPSEWIAALNKFHIDGLEFYDFENRHEQPLAGTVEDPAPMWRSIGGHEVDRAIIDGFLRYAHQYNMMTMAYNTSYCAYASAFTRGVVKLKWATWSKPDGPRTLQTAMALNLNGGKEWKTHRLVYMNQNSPEWQHYLFGQMAKLFQVYPFDGWHIDTFGTRGGYAYDGSYVNFIDGLPSFVDHASSALGKRIVVNTVNTWGQAGVAHSAAEFVYSELWEDHETYIDILAAAAQVHAANPQEGVVFAAYLQRHETKEAAKQQGEEFNVPGVLLADATIFASGASHIELGDGVRMLSSEYFPADTRLGISPDLYSDLRHYYDFVTAYENLLFFEVAPAHAAVSVAGQIVSPYGVPNTIWAIPRQKDRKTIVHLINLLGSDDPHWRDVHGNRPEPPLLTEVRVRLRVDGSVTGAGWASPDVDGGKFHSLAMRRGDDQGVPYVEVVLPSLRYWDMLVLSR